MWKAKKELWKNMDDIIQEILEIENITIGGDMN